MTNPFLPAQPAQPQQQAAPAPAPAGNPFAAPAPAAPQGYGTGLGTQTAAPVQQYAPTAATQAAPPALDLGRLAPAPAPIVGEGRGAKLPDMFGRLVLFFPLKIERVPPFRGANGQIQEVRSADGMRDRLTATVVVLDDGQGGQNPIGYGGNPQDLGGSPHTDWAPLPYVRKAMWIDQSRLIGQLRGSVPANPSQAPGMIAGRVAKVSPERNSAWYLIGASEAEVTLVRQYLEAVQAGAFPHPLAS